MIRLRLSALARLAAIAVLTLAVGVVLSSSLALAADTGWIIDRFAADIAIQRDGRLLVTEAIDVDFQFLIDRHGIFRDIPVRYQWDPDPRYQRVYHVSVQAVRDATGRPLTYETSDNGANLRIKIGDADRIVVGKQTYRITYTVAGALNPFSDHDELYWNVNGAEWSVPTRAASAIVRSPGDAFTSVTCYQGPTRSTKPCSSQLVGPRADFATTAQLQPGEQLTIVTALRKGTVPEPKPILEQRPRDLGDWFDATPWTLGATAFVMLGGVWAVWWRWWTAGRDQREREAIVAEFEPPDKLRPAQLGLLVDESADPKDVTATIVDLAVRGYLSITEIPSEGLFAKKDWVLTRKAGDGAALEPYERTILEGLFTSDALAAFRASATDEQRAAAARLGVDLTPTPPDERKLSELRLHFYTTLAKAQSQIYADSVTRKWFARDPQRVRQSYAGIGCLSLLAAGLAVVGLGVFLGAGLVGIGLLAPAIALVVVAPRMPAKTRDGAELFRRTLGFKQYMEVAETDRQRFAEKENIFSEYLPYAIVFGCVTQWARAFAGIDAAAATSSWYTGGAIGAFSAGDLSNNLSSFSNNVSSAIASTPGGSGSSGFGGGGGSGGGGGGGGGGSW